MKSLLTFTLIALLPTAAFAREVDVAGIIGIFFVLPLFVIIGVLLIILLAASSRGTDLSRNKSGKSNTDKDIEKDIEKDINIGP